jgi:hypothetical protein
MNYKKEFLSDIFMLKTFLFLVTLSVLPRSRLI